MSYEINITGKEICKECNKQFDISKFNKNEYVYKKRQHKKYMVYDFYCSYNCWRKADLITENIKKTKVSKKASKKFRKKEIKK